MIILSHAFANIFTKPFVNIVKYVANFALKIYKGIQQKLLNVQLLFEVFTHFGEGASPSLIVLFSATLDKWC